MKKLAAVAFLVVFGIGCGSSTPMEEVESSIRELCACQGNAACAKKAGKKFAAATKKLKATKLSADDAVKFGKIMGRAVTCQRDATSKANKGARDTMKKTSDAAKSYYK